MNIMLAWNGSLGISKYGGVISPAYCVFEVPNRVNPWYYHYLLRTNTYTDAFKTLSTGVIDSRLRLYPDKFYQIYVAIPPKHEQDQIVRYLDISLAKINKFIRTKKKLIKVLKEQKQAIIDQAVTKGVNSSVKMKPSGINWLGDIPEEWKVQKLRYIGNLQNGISESSEYFGTGFPFVSYGDVYKNLELPSTVSGLANSDEKQQVIYSVKEGDVFFTRTSETREEAGITSVCTRTIDKAVFSGFLIRLRPKEGILDKNFSKYYFRNSNIRDYFTREMNLVTRASLGQELLKNLPVLLPSLPEQKEIADSIERTTRPIEDLITATQKGITLMEEYRTRLISDVVTGKIDVRGIELDGVPEDLNEEDLDEELPEDEMLPDEDGDENAD